MIGGVLAFLSFFLSFFLGPFFLYFSLSLDPSIPFNRASNSRRHRNVIHSYFLYLSPLSSPNPNARPRKARIEPPRPLLHCSNYVPFVDVLCLLLLLRSYSKAEFTISYFCFSIAYYLSFFSILASFFFFLVSFSFKIGSLSSSQYRTHPPPFHRQTIGWARVLSTEEMKSQKISYKPLTRSIYKGSSNPHPPPRSITSASLVLVFIFALIHSPRSGLSSAY